MPEYKVIWHDCEDDRSGNPFTVNADNLVKGYFMAVDTIKGYSAYLTQHFVGIGIECLIDETGKLHSPDLFLEQGYVDRTSKTYSDHPKDSPGGGGPDSTLSQEQLDNINRRINAGLVDRNLVADLYVVDDGTNKGDEKVQ